MRVEVGSIGVRIHLRRAETGENGEKKGGGSNQRRAAEKLENAKLILLPLFCAIIQRGGGVKPFVYNLVNIKNSDDAKTSALTDITEGYLRCCKSC